MEMLEIPTNPLVTWSRPMEITVVWVSSVLVTVTSHQYCLTAKQYRITLGFPMLGDFELRGTQSDIERLAPIILEA